MKIKIETKRLLSLVKYNNNCIWPRPNERQHTALLSTIRISYGGGCADTGVVDPTQESVRVS